MKYEYLDRAQSRAPCGPLAAEPRPHGTWEDALALKIARAVRRGSRLPTPIVTDTETENADRYGATAAQWPNHPALTGDAADNIAGVKDVQPRRSLSCWPVEEVPCCRDWLRGDDDAARAAYLPAGLEEVRTAIDGGMHITGVHFWTGVDNYEWLEGSGVPFGLFDRNRVPRKSAHVVQSFMRS